MPRPSYLRRIAGEESGRVVLTPPRLLFRPAAVPVEVAPVEPRTTAAPSPVEAALAGPTASAAPSLVEAAPVAAKPAPPPPAPPPGLAAVVAPPPLTTGVVRREPASQRL